ncbi:hypothetical protein BJV82DRAFT_184465 [Fennellomyces sp. T-0311]|nr:hypothetical protein BJV82DRAFT_184465 [Fennellomyces sp. T-0311]
MIIIKSQKKADEFKKAQKDEQQDEFTDDCTPERGNDEDFVDEYAEGEDEEDEEENENASTTEDETRDQDSSKKNMRALLAIVPMLCESGNINFEVTPADIQKVAFKGVTLAEKEKNYAAQLVNNLRPFVQKRSPDGTRQEFEVFAAGPLARLTEAVLEYYDQADEVWLSSPDVSVKSALSLTATGLYYLLKSKFIFKDTENKWITSQVAARTRPKDIFDAIFQTFKLCNSLSKMKVHFIWSMKFVNR